MRAAVLHGKEDVRLEDVEVPRLDPGDILVRVSAALTCGTDVKVFRRGYHARMIVPPALFGHEAAGIVEEVGAEVEGLSIGAPIVAANSAPCGTCPDCLRGRPSLCDDLLFWNGAYAELVRIPARVVRRNLLIVPGNVGLREAAMTEPLACVVRGVEESGIEAGQTVAVIGAGPIGLMFVVLARKLGAEVLVAGRRPERLAKARELGASDTVSTTEGGDVGSLIRDRTPQGRGADVVVEAVGLPETSEAALRAVRKGGLVQLFGGGPSGSRIALDSERFHYEELTIRATFHHTPESVRRAFELIARGEVDPRPFITAEGPLERLPQVLAEMARGGAGLKTAIVP
jgi:L-iditol 2-dehydrogenase